LKYTDFVNMHANKKILVCGTGASVKAVPKEFIENHITIATNDFCRLGIKIDYLVFGDRIKAMRHDPFNVENNRAHYIKNFDAKYLFVHNYKENINHINEDLQDRVIDARCNELLNEGVYSRLTPYHSNNSGFMAATIAITMGAAKIGLIGIDFHGYHAFGKKHPNYLLSTPDRIRRANKDYKNLSNIWKEVGIYNLNSFSKITTLPKIDYKEF